MIEKTFITQNLKKIELENYISEELDKAGFTGLDIVKTPLVTRIVLNVTRPGLAIGKGGQNIKQLTKEIEERFGFNNPQIEIHEIQNPELDAKAVVGKVVSLLERGYSWRSVAFRTVGDIQRARAQGVELVFSGKLAGKGGRKRKQRIAVGYMKKAGNQVSLVDYAKGSAYPKAGAVGVKVRIIRPNVVFPDKINFRELLAKKQSVEQTVTVQEQAVMEKPAEKAETAAKPEKEEISAGKKEAEKKKALNKKENIAGGKQEAKKSEKAGENEINSHEKQSKEKHAAKKKTDREEKTKQKEKAKALEEKSGKKESKGKVKD